MGMCVLMSRFLPGRTKKTRQLPEHRTHQNFGPL